MRSTGSTTLTLPPFTGLTRRLVLVNLVTFFALGVLSLAMPLVAGRVPLVLGLVPRLVEHGWVWQPLTYSLVNTGLLGTAFGLLTLWFTATTLEEARGQRWLLRLYAGSAVAGGSIAVVITWLARIAFSRGSYAGADGGVYFGLFAPLFAVLVAFAMLYGDVEFVLFFLVRLKAKYLVAIMVLWRIGTLLWARDILAAIVELSCGLYAYLFVRYAQVGRSGHARMPALSERYFAMRNGYYRWKRRRAAKSFQVYMRKQDREVHFDNEGRYIAPEDAKRDPNDKRWMN